MGKRNRHVVTIDSFEDVPPNNEVALMKVQSGFRFIFRPNSPARKSNYCPTEQACTNACMHAQLLRWSPNAFCLMSQYVTRY